MVPGSIRSAQSRAANRLIYQGATSKGLITRYPGGKYGATVRGGAGP